MAKDKNKAAPAEPRAIATNPKFAVVKTLTLPAFKFEEQVAKYVHILDEMRISNAKNSKGEVGGKAEKMEPATVCNAVDAETGEKGTLIVPAVLKSIFEEEYKDAAYVGKTFELVKLPKPPGKRYHAWQVQEVAAQ